MVPTDIRCDGAMSELDQTRHFDRAPTTSGLPRLTEVRGAGRHVSKGP